MRSSIRMQYWPAAAIICLALANVRAGVCSPPANEKAAQPGFVPNVELKTADDVSVNLRQLAGDKVAVLHLLYTECVACDGGIKNLVKVQDELEREGLLGKKVVMFSITLDPAHDTPKVLKTFAESKHVKPDWTFLTGNAEQIQKIRAALEPPPLDLSASEKEAAKTLQHSGMLQIINGATGRRTSISATAKPQRILDLIDRVESPEP